MSKKIIKQELAHVSQLVEQYKKLEQDASTRYFLDTFTKSKELLELLDGNDIQWFFTKVKKYYQGWFSHELMDDDYMKSYFLEKHGSAYGYLGVKRFRRRVLDKHLEKKMKEQLLSSHEMALFLCSKTARQMFEEHSDLPTEDKKKLIDQKLKEITHETFHMYIEEELLQQDDSLSDSEENQINDLLK